MRLPIFSLLPATLVAALALSLVTPVSAQDAAPPSTISTAATATTTAVAAPVKVSARELLRAAALSAEEYRATVSATTVDDLVASETASPQSTAEAEAYLRAARELAGERVAACDELLTLTASLPPADPALPFLQAKEKLTTLRLRRAKEAALAASQAALPESLKGQVDRVRSDFLADQAGILTSFLAELEQTWLATYPDPADRKAAEAAAFKALSETKQTKQTQAEEKARTQAAALEAKQREAEELAQKARQELDQAKNKSEQQLAELRLAYAQLKSDYEGVKVKALEAEAEARRAEKDLDSTRARIAEVTPKMTSKDARPSNVAKQRGLFITAAERVDKRKQLLAEEVELLREQVPSIRARYQELADLYDELEDGMSAKGKNAIYRRRVYFARLAQRKASEKLDEFRTVVEWKDRKLLSMLRRVDALRKAIDELEPHSQVLYFGQQLDQWRRFLLFLLGTLVASFVAAFLGKTLFKSFSDRTRWTWDDIALEELTTPVRILVFLFGLKLSFAILTIPPEHQKMLASVAGALRAAWLGFLTWRIANIVARVVEPHIVKSEAKLDDQLFRFIQRGLRTAIVAVTLVFMLESFGWKVTSLLAGLGIGGLAFALAAKDTLANLFGSIVLFMDRPFRVGNWVIINGIEGVVEDIGIRSTRIRTFKDTLVTIPNAEVANSSAENVHSFRKRRLLFTLELRYDTPPDTLEEAVHRIRAILTDHPMVMDGFYVYITGLKASGVEIMVYSYVSTRDWGEWMVHCQDIYLSVLRMLAEINAGLAYPTQTVELEHVKGFGGMPEGFAPPVPGGKS